MLHVLLYALLCLAPALVLLPVRVLDREPRNEIAQEQSGPDDSGNERDPGAGIIPVAA